jgi:hypothetical protein
MPKLKPGTIIPTPKEDAEINAQIKADSDDFEWTEKIFREAKTGILHITSKVLYTFFKK